MESLKQFRKELDVIDKRIVESVGQRLDVCRRVAHYKKSEGIPMMQPDRVEQVKQRCAALATNHGVNPDFVVSLYSLMIEEACRLEDEIIESVGQNS